MDALATDDGEQVRREFSVKRSTLLAIAHTFAGYADTATGRGVAVRTELVAAQAAAALGRRRVYDRKTIQRAMSIIERLGFATTVRVGCYLTTAQRFAARAVHAGPQLKIASTRALTMPHPKNVALPRRGHVLNSQFSNEIDLNQRASARRTAAPRPSSREVRKPGQNPGRRSWSPWPEAMYRFAEAFGRLFPHLTQERHTASVCAMLHRAGINPDHWLTAERLRDRITAGMARVGIDRTTDAYRQRDPLAYMGWLLSQTIDPAEPTPAELAREARVEAQARRARRATQALAREAEALARQSVDAGEIRRLLDASDRAIEARRADVDLR